MPVPAGSSLPVPLNSLIGRDRDLEGVGEVLRRRRLVTVSGPGGVGKTRLALEMARRQLARRVDGVWLVDLAAGPETPPVAAETARVLGVRPPAGTTPIDALLTYLADRDVLLVLDNCEHVIDECASAAAALLGACPHVRILATSREPLGIDDETVWQLAPLEPADARRLFVERARQRIAVYVPDGAAETTIASLCARLDRLPLAIELAAARMSAMSAAEILAGVEARVVELSGALRRSPVHHRSLRATVEWSYRLLEHHEQEAFRRLAVFVGGFDAAAAEVAPGLSPAVLARLVDKSIVSAEAGPGGRTRYRLLESVREYAEELLADAGDLEETRRRHFHHFLARGNAGREGWPSAGAQAFVDDLEADYGNVRAALEWAAGADPCAGARLLSAMLDLFLMLGQADGRRLAELVLERCPDRDRSRVDVQISAGGLAYWTGDAESARRTLAEARELSVELGEPVLEGWARFFEGLVEMFSGSVEPARKHFEEGRRLHHGLGVRTGEARSTAALGLIAMMQGDNARAKDLVEEGLTIAIAADDRFAQGQSHTYLGMIAQAAGDARAATAHYRDAVHCLRPYRDATLLPIALVGQAGVLVERDPVTALQVATAASVMRARVGGTFPPFVETRAGALRRSAERALGTLAGPAGKEGMHLTVDDAIALAFGGSRRRVAPAGALSTREQEIAELVAQGLSNKEVAARLHLSVRTVESHMRRVLTKLGLTNRTQVANWMHHHDQ